MVRERRGGSSFPENHADIFLKALSLCGDIRYNRVTIVEVNALPSPQHPWQLFTANLQHDLCSSSA